ncbi:MAG: HD domain-containing protein [Sarcina sp.]
MEKEKIINNTKIFVKNELMNEGSGHDYYHVERVYKNASYILKYEKDADEFIVKLTALLHDIDDWKFSISNITNTSKVERFLNEQQLDKKIIEKIITIIKTMSFKGGVVDSKQITLEGKIVQDADRLDAIGAIGIARAFTYGGYKNNLIHDPNIKIKSFKTLEDVKSKNTTINHFYEKLLKLESLMNTESAKKIANERTIFMKMFLERFYQEWNIEK